MDEYKEVPTRANDEENANFLSKMFFTYLLPFLRVGYKRALKKQDFCQVAKNDESEYLADILERNWEDELEKRTKNNVPPDLHKAISKTFAGPFWFYSAFFFYQELLQCAQLFFMSRLIRYFQYCSGISISHAYIYAACFSMTSFLVVMVRHRPFHELVRVAMRLRIACSALIYKKSLKLNNAALREIEVGKIVNLLSNDVNRFDQAVLFLPFIWVAPLSLVLYLIFTWYEMGLSYVAGFLALLILNPCQMYMSRKAGALRQKIDIYTDKRISLMSDLLNGIRVIKMYAWEKPFADFVDKVRKLEIRQYRLVAFFDSIVYGLFFANTKIFILFAVLSSYYFDGVSGLKSDHIFVATAMFNMFRMPVGLFLPFAIKFLMEYKISVKRIQEFLLLKDQNVQCLPKENIRSQNDTNEECQVSMMNYSAKFSEQNETNVVEDINFNLKPGKLMMIVGPVGSGKSTVLQCLCGDVGLCTGGSMDIKGRFVYVPQQPWIFQGTVRQNIIFGKSDEKLHAKAYTDALKACSLNKDIENFPNKDKTIIGDRGAALSGGQKARIALARAVYYDADVYLLDDPLSAVDAAVGRWIFEKCLNDYLKSKTRILVTNQLQYLKYADHIIVLKDGKVQASGSYDDLSALGDRFTSILRETEESFQKCQQDQKQQKAEETRKKQQGYEETESEEEDSRSIASTSRMSARFRRSKRMSSARKNKEDKEKDDMHDEMASEGNIKWKVVAAYFGSIGNCFTIFALFALFVVAQVLFNLSDLWLNVWVDKEDLAKLNARVIHSMGTNFTLNDQCLLSMPKVAGLLISLNYSAPSGGNDSAEDFADEESIYNPKLYMWIFVLSVLLVTVTSILRSLCLKFLLTRSSLKLHKNMFRSLVKAPVWFYDMNPVGRILNRFSKDTGSMDEQLSFVAFDLLTGLLSFFGILIVIGMLNPWILFVMIPLCMLCLIMRHYYVCSSRSVKRLEATTKSPIYAHLSATIYGLACIRTMNSQKAVLVDFHRFQNFHTSVFYASISIARWFGIHIDCLCVIFIALVSFINVSSSQDQSAGTVGLSLFYAAALLNFLQWTIRQTTEVETLLVSVERIIEYGDLLTELEDQGSGPLSVTPPPDWPSKGEIIFKNLKMKYNEKSDYILKGLSLNILGGEKIGIVGRTGAGKSSIINALFRLCRVEGLISIDGIDINSIDLQELRKRICIIPQDPVLFIGTLRQNLDPLEEYDDDEIWRALELVELKSAFKNDEDLAFTIQEGGANLSVGQRQLICLARALLRRNKIIVVDEATANVDLHTDKLIQHTIRAQFRDCTVLTIAHRIDTIIDYTKIVVMNDGQIAEMGPPAVLLAKEDGAFATLCRESRKNLQQ